MAELFLMPQASPTMEAGTILSWAKKEGDALKVMDVIAEVETDKAAMQIEVFDKGYLLKILVPAGDSVPAGHPIAIIGKTATEDFSHLLGATAAAPAPAPAPAPVEAPKAAPAPVVAALVVEKAEPVKAGGGVKAYTWLGASVPDAVMENVGFDFGDEEAAAGPAGKPRSAPAARRAAREHGLAIEDIAGTGPHGRVTRADVEKAASAPKVAAPAPVAAPASESVRNSQMRKTIAKRLKASWNDAPAFFLTAAFDCDALVRFRDQLVAGGIKVSYNDLLIKAAARALREVPEVNASWGEEAITRHSGVHIGVAVALPDGLITPVIRDADQKGVGRIASEMRDLATRAKDRKLQPEEYTGSTFSISNLGMMGIEQFTAILNPPESLILAVGAMVREVVVDAAGNPAVGWRMRVTLTCDHRVVDGALGARFLQAMRKYLEAPALLAA